MTGAGLVIDRATPPMTMLDQKRAKRPTLFQEEDENDC